MGSLFAFAKKTHTFIGDYSHLKEDDYMFAKYVTFNLDGGYHLARVIETLSTYRHGMKDECDLKIISRPDNTLANSLRFSVSLHCREEELTSCLDDILRLNREGACIYKLTVK